MTSSKQLLKNTIASYAAQITVVLVGLFLTPFLVHSLGEVQFGIWSLTGSLIAYFGLLDLGFSTAVAKYIAQFQAQNEADKANRVVSTLFFVHCVFGLLILVVLVFFSRYFSRVFNIPASYAVIARVVLLIVGTDFALSLSGGIFNAVLVGCQRLDLNNSLGIASQIIRVGLIVTLFNMGLGLVALATIGAGTTLLLALSRAYTIKRISPHFQLRLSLFDHRIITSAVMKYSGMIFGLEVTRLLLFNTDNVIIGRFLTVVDITPYAIAYKVSSLLLVLASPLMYVLFPSFSELDALGDRENARRLFRAGTEMALALTLPLAGFIVIIGDSLITLWVGAEFVSRAVPILNVLTIFFLGYAISRPAHALLVGTGRIKWYLVANSVMVLANIVLSIALARHYGSLGVALGSAIPLLVAFGVFLFPYSCRLVGLPFIELSKRFIPPLIPALSVGGLMLLLSRYLRPTSFAILGLEFALYMGLYAVIYIMVFTGKKEREHYVHLARGVLRRGEVHSEGYQPR